MLVQDGMNEVVVTAGPAHSLREVAHRMSERDVGAAVVLDSELPGPGIITERDILRAVGRGLDLEKELVGDHLTAEVVYAEPSWPMERAATAMVRGGFRHVIVVEESEVAGILSMRDVVRCWTAAGEIPELSPAPTG